MNYIRYIFKSVDDVNLSKILDWGSEHNIDKGRHMDHTFTISPWDYLLNRSTQDNHSEGRVPSSEVVSSWLSRILGRRKCMVGGG